MLSTASSQNSRVFVGLILIVCVLIGKLVTDLPLTIPVVLALGLGMLFLCAANTHTAMIFLIYAMLLSPEISLGAVSSRRSVVVRIEDLLLIVFALTWIGRVAVDGKLRFLVKTPLNRFIGLYTFCFVLATVVAMLVNPRIRILGATFYVLKYIEYFLIFYLAAGTLQDKRQVRSYLKAFLITFAIVNVYAYTQIGTGRVSAPFEGEIGEPNTLGGYQVLMLGLIIGLLTHMKSQRWRLPLVGLALLTLLPFAHTLSRASYMAIVPMYLTHVVFNKQKTRTVLIGIMIVLIILAVFLLPQNVKDRIAYTFVPEEQEGIETAVIMGVELGPSASARIQDWKRLFGLWKKHPYLGYGVTGQGFLDSQFIRTLVETGILGFTAFCTLLGAIFIHTLRIYRAAQDDLLQGLALGFLAGHAGMIFHAITANTFILIRIMEPYWFLAALVMMIPKIEKKLQEKKEIAKDNEVVLRNSHILLNGRTV